MNFKYFTDIQLVFDLITLFQSAEARVKKQIDIHNRKKVYIAEYHVPLYILSNDKKNYLTFSKVFAWIQLNCKIM